MSAIGSRRRGRTWEMPPRADSGFTLLEMLVALAILGLISGIGFPAVERMIGRRDFADAADMVMLSLVEARADAIAGGRPVSVRLAAGRNALLFSSAQPPATLPAGVGISWPAGGFTFFADGTASGGEAAVERKGLLRRFRVAPATSRIAVSA